MHGMAWHTGASTAKIEQHRWALQKTLQNDKIRAPSSASSERVVRTLHVGKMPDVDDNSPIAESDIYNLNVELGEGKVMSG